MKLLLVTMLLVCWLGAGWAQTRPAQPAKPLEDDPQARIILDVTRVNLLFTVTDKRGRFVTDLTKDDFTVREGKNFQKILEFTAESDLPLRLAILVDSSNSIRDRFRFIQEAAIEFLTSVMRPQQDKSAVISFDTAAELQADLSNDVEAQARAIRQLRAGGGTSLYDAIFYASRDKLMLDQPRHKFRRAMVILSDGDDNQSRYTRDQALEMAQKADVVIYTISTNITRIRDRRRQSPEIPFLRDGRHDLLPVQGGGSVAVLREHRQRDAPPVQLALPAGAHEDGRLLSSGRAQGEDPQ